MFQVDSDAATKSEVSSEVLESERVETAAPTAAAVQQPLPTGSVASLSLSNGQTGADNPSRVVKFEKIDHHLALHMLHSRPDVLAKHLRVMGHDPDKYLGKDGHHREDDSEWDTSTDEDADNNEE